MEDGTGKNFKAAIRKNDKVWGNCNKSWWEREDERKRIGGVVSKDVKFNTWSSWRRQEKEKLMGEDEETGRKRTVN